MKVIYTWLALTGVALLPACTVHYYGVDPNSKEYRTRRVHTYHTDTVYVAGGSTTVITQPGTVGGPRGGYYGNGPGRQNPQPPVRGGYGQNGGVRTPPGSYPPPRTGGVRTPASGQPSAPTTGTQAPPIRTPGAGTSTPSGPIRTTPSGGTAGNTNPGSGPAGNGGTPTGGGQNQQQQYPTGGIKPIPSTASSGPISTSAPTSAEGPGPRTGGIKPVRNSETNTGGPQHTDVFETGGIKPIPTTAGTPATSTPTTGTEVPSPHTGDIKPVRGHNNNNGGTKYVDGYETGGIKPVRNSETNNGGPKHDEVFETGGYKAIPGTQPTHSGEMPIASGSELPAGTQANSGGTEAMPALVFAKMPCRGTCPAYTATIWPNGRVVYVGQQHVERIGTYELQLEPAAVANIQQQAKSIHFADLPNSFASGNADIPSTMLTMYTPGGSNKTVSVEDSAPAEVQALFDNIHGTLTQLIANTQFSEQRIRPRSGR